MKLHLLTYATPNFAGQAQSLADSALAAGFDSARVAGYGPMLLLREYLRLRRFRGQ